MGSVSSPSEDPGIRAATVERTQKYQRINADCQTIAGDRDQWRLRVLDVAKTEKAGAAVESESKCSQPGGAKVWCVMHRNGDMLDRFPTRLPDG
jgi:hypothetical protein